MLNPIMSWYYSTNRDSVATFLWDTGTYVPSVFKGNTSHTRVAVLNVVGVYLTEHWEINSGLHNAAFHGVGGMCTCSSSQATVANIHNIEAPTIIGDLVECHF